MATAFSSERSDELCRLCADRRFTVLSSPHLQTGKPKKTNLENKSVLGLCPEEPSNMQTKSERNLRIPCHHCSSKLLHRTTISFVKFQKNSWGHVSYFPIGFLSSVTGVLHKSKYIYIHSDPPRVLTTYPLTPPPYFLGNFYRKLA